MIIKESANSNYKMYLEDNPGGKGLLITDGHKWLYVNDYELQYSDVVFGDDNKENIEKVKKAIANGELYDAEEFMNDFEMFERFHIPEYDNMTIDDIDEEVNYETDSYSGVRYPKGHDYTTWEEV